MIIWRGRGILVVVIGFCALLVTQLLVDAAAGDGYYEAHAFPKVLAGLVAAVPIWFLGKKWNEESGRHDLFFIPMQYWALIIVTLMLWAAKAPEESSDPAAEQERVARTAPESGEAASVAPEADVPATKAAVLSSADMTSFARHPDRSTAERPDFSAPAVAKYVYADKASHQYYPEDCLARPASASRTGRNAALLQGYRLAPSCTE